MIAGLQRFPGKLDFKNGHIDLSHGSGGRASAQLLQECFLKHFSNPWLDAQNDNAVFNVNKGRMVVSTDSHVISPLFFPGGNIGSLAVHGTINDVAVSGAVPLYLTAGFILEEGFALSALETIVKSMAAAAHDAGIAIIAGDTKVVEKGKGDGVFINTTGVGVLANNTHISGDRAKVGDSIIISGTMGDHGTTIMASRENLEFNTPLQSDSAALHELIADMLGTGADIHCLRDPTRGGLATILNELAQQSNIGMRIYESKIPVTSSVRAACELLGLDPLYLANEGKLVCICDSADANKVLTTMQAHPLGRQSAIIGHVIHDDHQFVQMETSFGGFRLVDWLQGEPLPRIC